ncbi:MAG: hypothetical protein WAQ30_07875 [Bacillota bacterium]
MFYSKTRVHRSFTAMFTLVFIVVVSVLAGQALCFAEDEIQQDRVGTDTSMPSTLLGTAGMSATEATHAQLYIGLYEDGQFVGDKVVTREQLSNILDRILGDIQDGRIFVESTDAKLLRDLVVKQHEQIVQLNMQIDILKEEMHELNKRAVRLTEDNLSLAEQVNDTLSRIEDFAAELEKYVLHEAALNSEALNTEISALRAFRDEVESLLQELKDDFTRLEDEFGDEFSRLKEEFRNSFESEKKMLALRMSNLRSEVKTEMSETLSDLSVRVENFESSNESLEAQIKAQQERISELEYQILVDKSRYEADLKKLNDKILSLEARLSALERTASGDSSAL